MAAPERGKGPVAILPSRRPRILLADDSEVAREDAAEKLEVCGYEVQAVGSGEDAVSAAKETKPDGIIMDCKMSKMDGVDALVEIAKQTPGTRIPVAVRSAFLGDGAYQRKAKERGVTVNQWYGDESRPEDLVAFVRHYVELPMLVRAIESQLGEYRQFLGDISDLKEIAAYEGVVDEIDLPAEEGQHGEAHVVFMTKNGEFTRVFPATRLEAAGACFLDARVRYTIFTLREKCISVMRYVGPDKEEMLRAPLAVPKDSDIRELEA